MNKIRQYTSLLGISLCIAFLTSCTGKATREKWIPEKARNLELATAYINERCPEMVDQETRLDSVSLSRERQLHFYYTLPERELTSISGMAFTAYMIPEILKNIHSNPDLKLHRDSSLTMVFYYLDKNGKQITEITLGPEKYK